MHGIDRELIARDATTVGLASSAPGSLEISQTACLDPAEMSRWMTLSVAEPRAAHTGRPGRHDRLPQRLDVPGFNHSRNAMVERLAKQLGERPRRPCNGRTRSRRRLDHRRMAAAAAAQPATTARDLVARRAPPGLRRLTVTRPGTSPPPPGRRAARGRYPRGGSGRWPAHSPDRRWRVPAWRSARP